MVSWPVQVPTGEVVPGVPPSVSARKLHEGLFFRIELGAPPPPGTLAALRGYVAAHGLKPPAEVPTPSLILLVKSAQEIQARYVLGEEVCEVVLLPEGPVPAEGRSPSGLRALTGAARVGIVGVGSIGSKVATSLARSGVRRFVLVDGDVFLPENVVRHEGTYVHAGLMKTDVARVQIEAAALEPATVRVFDHGIGDASNAEIHARTLEALSGVDVLVDATANARAFNILASLASDIRHPLVWGEVFAGGLGGLIAYAHPGLTPCPSCVRAAFLAHADEWPPAPRGRGDAAYAGQDGGRPVVATDAEVTVIAGLLASTTLRMIQAPDERGPAVTLVGFRQGWIFSRPLETHHVQVRSDDFSCQWCWAPPSASDPSLLGQVEALLKSSPHDHDPPQS